MNGSENDFESSLVIGFAIGFVICLGYGLGIVHGKAQKMVWGFVLTVN